MFNESKLKAKESLKEDMWSLKELGLNTVVKRNGAVAKNVLDEEMGLFGEPYEIYSLDEPTRDRLLAHGRQDAAHALVNSISTIELLEKVLRAIRWLILTIIVCTAIIYWKLNS